MLRVWNLSLLVATFALTILGTFLTRSGLLSSVHAFGDGPVGAYLLAFFGIVVVVSLGLIAWRGDRLRSPGAIDSPLSREGAFLANNVLFAVFAFVVLLGTVFPLFVEASQDRQTMVGAPYFDRLSTPIGLDAAVPDGGRARCCRGARRAPSCSATGCSGRRGAASARWASPSSLGADGLGAAVAFGLAGFAAGVGAAPGRAGDAPSGLARPGRARQRRHDRAPRRDRRSRSRWRRRTATPARRRSRLDAGEPVVVRRSHVRARRRRLRENDRERVVRPTCWSTATRCTARRSPRTSPAARTSCTPSVRTGLDQGHLPGDGAAAPPPVTPRRRSGCSSSRSSCGCGSAAC